eukprot:102990_1
MAADPNVASSIDNNEEPEEESESNDWCTEEKSNAKPEPKPNAKANTPPPLEPVPPVKLVVYDFDQTITTIHLYHVLSGMQGDQNSALQTMSDRELTKIFGGSKRIQRLNVHFDRLCNAGTTIGIVSYGYVSVIRKALNRMKLDQFSECVVIGGDSIELEEVNDDKGECIKKQFYSSFDSSSILFVDDDRYNTDAAKQQKICQTLTIEPRSGMTEDHME